MAYTPVPTVNAGDLWTAAQHNTYIKDNFASGVPDLFTTKGDIVVATGNDAASRLGVGNYKEILYPSTGTATGLEWGALQNITFPVRASKLSQTINNDTITLIEFSTETFDPLGCFTTGAAAKYTAPMTGYYQVNVRLSFSLLDLADTGEQMSLYIYKNGGNYIILDHHYMEGTPSSHYVFLQGSDIVDMNAGDYIDVRVYQNTGSGEAVEYASISVSRVG